MKRQAVFALVGAGVLTTCCPTLWLTVTKNDPMPRFSSPLPVIAATPISTPPALTNRADVLANGARVELDPRYTDYVAPGADPIAVIEGARQTLPMLFSKVGKQLGAPLPISVSTSCGKGVVALCEQPNAHTCISVTLDEAWTYGDGPVQVTIDNGGRQVVSLVQAVQSTDLVLTTALDGPEVHEHDPVHVCKATDLGLSRTLLSFVHMSDIQLRDGSVKLEDPEISKRLDWLIQSFEYDPDLEFYNPYVVQALFATVNAEARSYADRHDPKRPSFIVHTGDSIDAGVMSELHMFHALVHTLAIPLFEVIGNHDSLVFGNLLPTSDDNDKKCATVRSLAGPSFLTHLVPEKICVAQKVECPNGLCIGDEADLVARSVHADTVQSFVGGLVDTPTDVIGVSHGVGSRDHGFDLNHNLGYYSFYQPLAFDDGRDAAAMFVVLDAQDLEPNTGGTDGRIGDKQAAWLHQVIDCEKAHPYDLMFVLAHQPIGGITYPAGSKTTLEDELDSAKNMVAFLFGHYHEHRICDTDARRKHDPVCSHFWEVETGSVIEFPQEARMIRVKQVSSTMGFLEMFTFGEHVDPAQVEFRKLVDLGHRGAERDRCRSHPELSCSDDLRPYRTDGRHTNARLFFELPHPAVGVSGELEQPKPEHAERCATFEKDRASAIRSK